MERRLELVMYLTHLIGDMHQPLHGSKRTGDQDVVVVGNQERTLHAVWDGDLFDTSGITRKEYAAQIDAKTIVNGVVAAPVVQWALESRDICHDVIIPSYNAAYGETGAVIIDDHYKMWAGKIVEERIKMAGLRLASSLNAAFGTDYGKD